MVLRERLASATIGTTYDQVTSGGCDGHADGIAALLTCSKMVPPFAEFGFARTHVR